VSLCLRGKKFVFNIYLTNTNSREFATSCPQGKFVAKDFELRKSYIIEIRESVGNGEIIEDYPNDKYGPSCLIFGMTSSLRPLHIQCSYPNRSLVKIITVYEPNHAEWIDYRERR